MRFGDFFNSLHFICIIFCLTIQICSIFALYENFLPTFFTKKCDSDGCTKPNRTARPIGARSIEELHHLRLDFFVGFSIAGKGSASVLVAAHRSDRIRILGPSYRGCRRTCDGQGATRRFRRAAAALPRASSDRAPSPPDRGPQGGTPP